MIDDGAIAVEIRGGPLAFQKTIVRPGFSLRFGRSEPAEVIVAHDDALSRVHFTIEWKDGRFWLSDRKSASGTQLNGKRVERAELSHKDWIHAGNSHFTVASQALVIGDDEPPLQDGKGAVFDFLDDLRAPLFAVLDASRDSRILELLRATDERYRSLYDGIQAESLADVAPYLVELPRATSVLDRLVREGWGNGWGIFLSARRPFDEVRRQLRRILMVNDDETNEKMYFRFYDPGVLRDVWPTCSVRQRSDIMGELEQVFAEGEQGEVLSFESPAKASA